MTRPSRGDLEPTTLPRLLLELHAAGFEGALTLARDQVEKTFLFHEGCPVHAESNRASESLAQRLKDAGTLSPAEHARLVAFARQQGCPEAKAALALGLLDARALLGALREQVRLCLVECFGWDRGRFELDPEAAPPDAARALATSPWALVQEGIETHWSPDRILGELAPHMAHYPTRGHGLARVASELRRDDRVDALLAALGGERTLWQLVQGPGAVRALAAVWVLEAARAIQWRDAPTGASAQAPRVEILVKAQGQARERPRSRRAARGPAAPGTPAPAAAEALVRNILERFEHLEGLDHYALLGIDRGADSADVKRAYLTAAKTYHPDVIARAGLDGETRVRANKVFAAIGKAYATLSDPQRRRQYDLGLGSGAERDAERLATAEGLYRKGEVLLRQGNFRGAVEFLEPAVELWPEEAEYQSALGWALYKKLPSEPERARTHLEAAATLDPSDQSVIFRLGVVMRSLGTQAAR